MRRTHIDLYGGQRVSRTGRYRQRYSEPALRDLQKCRYFRSFRRNCPYRRRLSEIIIAQSSYIKRADWMIQSALFCLSEYFCGSNLILLPQKYFFTGRPTPLTCGMSPLWKHAAPRQIPALLPPRYSPRYHRQKRTLPPSIHTFPVTHGRSPVPA